MGRGFALLLLLVIVGSTQLAVAPAAAQVSVGINVPAISIGINLPVFPRLVVVPSYPVYYAPAVHANYFFYDGFYWVFNVEDGQWYSSSWYNGPWVFVEPWYVPQPILVVPFRFYRVRPVYWGGWAFDAPPRWGHHWGREWEARRAGWDRWDRTRAIAPAPLPVYQREYTRGRYPAPAQQVIIHNERYKHQAQDTHVQQQRPAIFRQQASGGAKASVKAERVEQARERPQRQEAAPPPARSRQETAPRQEGPAVERGQPERGRGPEQQRVEPQPKAPRGEQAAPQQAPRGERPPARQPAEQPGAQRPPVQQHPDQSPREERREERQQERGPQGRSGEGPGQGRR